MIFDWNKRYKRYLEVRIERENLIKNHEETKARYEALKKEFDSFSEKVIRDTERLRLTEERALESQKEAELRLRIAQNSASPETIFKDCLKLAMRICWDLNRENTLNIIEKVKFEESEKERLKYEISVDKFLKKFDYVDDIMSPQSIAKMYDTLKNEKLAAERQGNKIALAIINNKLNTIKELGIIR